MLEYGKLAFQKGKIPRLHQVKIPHMVLASEASRYRCRPQRSEQAAAGVWGRSPQRGPGAAPRWGARGRSPRKIFGTTCRLDEF